MSRVNVRLWVAAISAAFFCLAGTPARGQDVPALPVRSTTLSNGLRVVVVEDHAAPVVQTGVWYRFGSLYEQPGKTGLAHALEHMMFRGTPNISASGLDDIVAHVGAQMNAETNYDYTHFYFVMPSDKVSIALAIEADRMRNAQIAQSEWRVERGAVLSELDGDASSPFFSLLSSVRAAAYPDSPAGLTSLGKRNDVVGATANDIRKYYEQWYAPNNAILVVAGDAAPAAVFAIARKMFGSIPPKVLPKYDSGRPAAAHGKTAESDFPFPFEVVDMAYAIPGDAERGEPEMSALAALIANQRGPFYRALVETNVALAVMANADTQLRGGIMHVFIVLNRARDAGEAQAIFQNTMDQLLHNGIDPELVSTARHATIAERALGSDSISGVEYLVGYTYGIVRERVEDEDQRLQAITPQSMLSVAREFLSAPTVVGHLRPSDKPPTGSSQKSTSNATDDFSARVPSGKIVVPPVIASQMRVPTGAHGKLLPQIFHLSNGMTLAVQQRTDRPTITMRGSISAAAAFEPAGKAGIARLASDLANFGSAQFAFDAQHKTIDDLGGQVTLGQSFEAHIFSRDLERALALLADGEAHPTFPERYFAQERDQLAGSIGQEQNISGQAVQRAYLQLLLNANDPALRFPSEQTVKSISRADLLAYVQNYWRPDLTTLALVGDVTPERARAAVEAAFDGWRSPGATPPAHEPDLPAAHAAHAYVGTDAGEVFIQIGQPVLARSNPDYNALLLLNEILAGSGAFESRLLNEMRQKRGLVYSVSGKIDSDRDRGDMTIVLSAAPAKVESAVRFVRSQLRELQRHEVTQTELVDAKARASSDALLAEESQAGEARQLLDLVRNNLPSNYFATLADRNARITPADLLRVAKTYLRPDALIEIYAGPPGPWSEHSLFQ
ncbi:MAG: hypothetical protein DLM50_05190 [Candidatus Meridianibacter frigidus]|nr:MAG: hypothetical protein DLM50_05190 [Candidatus Eremiobacteraeota bacterium]